MKQCLVMQHVAFEDLGTFAPVLEEKGFAIRYCPVDEPPTEEEWLAADLAVVLGGAIGVYDQVLYPFLKDEKDLIRKRLESQKPLLGICRRVLHWYGDSFDLPEGAELLASTPVTPHQAFRMGNHVLALQFHPEVDADKLERWFVGHACELARAAIDPRRLRDETKRAGESAKETGQALLREWIDQW